MNVYEAGRWDEEQKTVQIFVIELEKSCAVIMQSQLESDEVVGDISGIEDYDYCWWMMSHREKIALISSLHEFKAQKSNYVDAGRVTVDLKSSAVDRPRRFISFFLRIEIRYSTCISWCSLQWRSFTDQ